MQRRAFLSGLAGLPAAGALAGPYAPPAATLARPAVPQRDALGLQVTNETGDPVRLAEYAGRIVILNLWGPWCLPCRREMPSLSRLSSQVDPARIAVLPLAFDWRGPVWVRRFFGETGINNLPVLMGDGENLKAVLGLEDLPTTAVLNPAGRHIYTVAGEARWDDAATLAWLDDLSQSATEG